MEQNLKTLWKAQAKKDRCYVTREEIPGLIRSTIAEMITGISMAQQFSMTDPIIIGSALRDMVKQEGSRGRPTRYPRAPGCKHRGRCGSKCFEKAAKKK